jgi:hypothetical protein
MIAFEYSNSFVAVRGIEKALCLVVASDLHHCEVYDG